MTAGEQVSNQVSFKLVDRGWDPAEVIEFIEELESRLRRFWRAEISSTTEREGPEVVLATAEHRADEISSRAATEAGRIRLKAADDARATRIDAKRDALDLVVSGRILADEIVQRARVQEQALYERLMELRTVVRQTEKLLETVAGSDPVLRSGTPRDPAPDDFRITLDGAATIEPRGPADATGAESMPAEVRRLLQRLEAGRGDPS